MSLRISGLRIFSAASVVLTTRLVFSVRCNFRPLCGVMYRTGTIFLSGALTQLPVHQAMIFSAITLALLSILVATDPEPVASTDMLPPSEPPVRPTNQGDKGKSAEPNQLAA